MVKKEKPEPVNPKMLVRRMYLALGGLDIELREIVIALWCYSGTFIEAEDIRNGSVSFSSRASQSQLAKSCSLKTEKSVYSRLKRLNELGIVEWVANRSHKSNEYHVNLDFTSVVQATDDTDENPFEEIPTGDPLATRSSVVEDSSSVVCAVSSVVEDSSSVVQTTGSGFSGSYDLAISGSREQHDIRFAETRETLDPKEQPQPLLATAHPPVHPPAAQPIDVPPRPPHDWPPRSERTDETLCNRGCGVTWGEFKYLREECIPWEESGAAAQSLVVQEIELPKSKAFDLEDS